MVAASWTSRQAAGAAGAVGTLAVSALALGALAFGALAFGASSAGCRCRFFPLPPPTEGGNVAPATAAGLSAEAWPRSAIVALTRASAKVPLAHLKGCENRASSPVSAAVRCGVGDAPAWRRRRAGVASAARRRGVGMCRGTAPTTCRAGARHGMRESASCVGAEGGDLRAGDAKKIRCEKVGGGAQCGALEVRLTRGAGARPRAPERRADA